MWHFARLQPYKFISHIGTTKLFKRFLPSDSYSRYRIWHHAKKYYALVFLWINKNSVIKKC